MWHPPPQKKKKKEKSKTYFLHKAEGNLPKKKQMYLSNYDHELSSFKWDDTVKSVAGMATDFDNKLQYANFAPLNVLSSVIKFQN